MALDRLADTSSNWALAVTNQQLTAKGTGVCFDWNRSRILEFVR